MSIIDPKTGRPVNNSKPTDMATQAIQELIALAQHQENRINTIQAQCFYLSMVVDFFIQKATEGDKPLINIDMNEFPEWAKERKAEIKEMEAAKRGVDLEEKN
jgi:hypothetical protein